MQNKTVLVTAHRLSAIAALDRLVALDGGTILGAASHTTIAAKSMTLRRTLGTSIRCFLVE